MAEDKVLKYQITTEDGKVHNVSKSNIEKYGWGGYAEDYPKATVRMRDENNEDYDIPIAQVDNALARNFRPFTTQFNRVETKPAKKPQEQPQPQQEQGPFKPTPDDDARMAELMGSVGGTLYGSEQSRKQLGQPFKPALDVERTKIGEQTPDNIGKHYERAVEIMQFGPDVEGTRQQLENDIKNDLVESRREDSKATTYNPYTGTSAMRSKKTANLEAASAFLDSADMIQKAATAEGGWYSDLARGVRDAFRDPATLTFGLSSADQYRSVFRVIKKIEKGEQLSKDEQTLLDAAAYNMYVAATNNPNLSTAYTVGKGAAESLPFMVEFLVNPISGVGKKAAKELAEYTVKKYAGKAIGKYLTGGLAKTAARKAGKFALGAAANVVPASAMALTTSAPRTVGGMYERMVGEVKPEVAADMRTIVYGGHEGENNVGKALAKSYASTTIENWSEFLGDQFGDILPAVGKLFGRTKIGTKIMDTKAVRSVTDFMDKVNKTDLAKTIKDIEEAVQFNGTFGEFAEEVAGGIANAIVVGDQELNAGERGVFNPDNLIQTYLTCAVIGALPAGLRLTGYTASKLSNNKLKMADAAAGKAMGESWPQMREQILNASNEARADYLKQVVTSPVFSAEDKKAVLTYVGEVAKREAAAEFKRMKKDDPAYSAYENRKDIINNYNEASAAIGEEQKSEFDNYANYDEWYLQNKNASEEKSDDAYLYLNARRDMYDYVDEMNARIKDRVDARMHEVDNLTNPDTGEVITVASNYYQQPVNIVGGRLVFDKAGNVDVQASDKIIYYVDNNGKRMMATPDKFTSLVSRASAADMRQQVQQEEEAGAWADEEVEMSRPEVKTGSEVITPDGRQGIVTEVGSDYLVVNVEGQDIAYDPSEVSIPTPMQAETVQQPVAGQPSQVEQPQAQQQEGMAGTTPQPEVQPAEVQQPGPQIPSGQIPQDEKGNYLFTQVPAEQTYAYLYSQEDITPEEAGMIVDQNIQEAQKRIEKLTSNGPKVTPNINEFRANKAKWEAEKQQAQADLDYWNQVKAIGETQSQTSTEPEGQQVETAGQVEQPAQTEEVQSEVSPVSDGTEEVPDVTNDKAEDARKRGYRLVNGVQVNRQEPISATEGSETEVIFSSKDKVPAKFAIIESDDIQPSHISGQRNNQFFIDEAQPKDRVDKASINTEDKIASNINPEEITTGVTAYVGSPVVNSRGEVIQGNNRSAGLKQMYNSNAEQSQKYKDYLSQNAQKFGLTPEEISSMENPVLVRMIDVNDNEAIRLGNLNAQDTESGGYERIKPQQSVGRLGDKFQSFMRILLNSADEDASYSEVINNNAVDALKFLRQQNAISDTQYQSAFDNNGDVTVEAKADLKAMAEASLFEGGPTMLPQAFAVLPSKAQKAILQTFMRDANSAPESQIKTDIQNAIMLFREAIQFQEFADAKTYEAAKKALNIFSLQGDIFNDNRTPGDRYDDFAFELAARFKGNTQKRMVQDFNEYYNMVQGEGATLFNPDVTETTKNEAVKKLYNIDIKEDGTETENDMAGDTESSQDGGQRSETDGTVGESDETGEQPAESGAGTESDITGEAKPITFEQMKEKALSVPGVTVFEEVTVEDGSKGIKVGNKKSTTTYWYDDLSGENGKEELDFLNKQLQKYKDSHSENEMLSKVKDASDFYEYLKKKGEADPKRGVAGYDIKMYVSQAKEALSNERYMENVSIPIIEYITSKQWKGKEIIEEKKEDNVPGIQDNLDDLENDMMEAGSEYDAAVEDNVGVEEARQKYKDAFYAYWSRTGLSEAEINDKWSKSEAETKQEQPKTDELTVEEINGTDFEQELKDYAIDYINGIITIHTQTAYKQIYDYVRNRPRNNESDSQPADGTQLDGRIDESERGESRQGGEQAEQVDRGTSEKDVPGESAGVSDDKGSSAVPDGTEGGAEVSGEESANDGVSSGTSGRKGGRRTGSKGDNVRTRKGGRRSKSDTQVIPEPISETESERDSLLDELYGLLDDFTKAGKGELSVSVVGMNSKQIEILSKIVVVSAKIGYTYIKEGVYKFQQWSEVMKDKFTSKTPLASVLNFTDADVDQFISDTWNSNFTLNGERRPLREWAAMMEKEELRKKVRSTLEEKREAQRKAENVEVKIGNRANISETLPFLLPEQQEDVMRAETQFFDESHNDRDHAFGKGYLFTNGTGTGKTYTGLGIVKRFVKQGKGRVLILTPSQAKVSDWANDGKNLGLDITPLESTKDKGTGVVITTFANFRSNKALFEDVFDLVVYDESHRIMENKEGARTAGVANHFMITNKNKKEALERMKKVHPLWIEEGELQSEYNSLSTMMADLDMMQEEYAEKDQRREDIDKRLEEIRKEQEKVLPGMEREAEEAAKRTKVVFLSATPFNTIMSLDYAEGYIFSYPEEDKETIGAYRHRSPKAEFLEKNFGAGFRFRYGHIESHVENPEALSQQEVQFSDYLENTLGTKSGRIIDSEYDYSRDFPTVTFQFAPMFNGALEDIYLGDKELRPLSDIASGIFNDYNYSTALFETMKVSAITPRIKEHLAKGRKVVIFHRRVSSKEPLQPPFAYMLDAAESIFNNMDTTTEEGKKQKKAIRNAIDKFRQKYDRLLKYEQTLNYKLPRVQIADEFGAENVLFFSGQESKKVKNEAISQFNDDNSGKNIIVIQEESGKEGISLHDTTGNHQRVLISLALPQSPITALQIEGRIYRIGNKSNAIFEYPLLGLNQEINLFAQKFNQRVSTTENLALGSMARNLRDSFADGVIDSSGDVLLDSQGVGGKEKDNAGKAEGSDYDKAILDYYGTQKITGSRDSREGKDFYPTPEPVGFKMVEWAGIQEGEDVLEPSAGMGAIARYVPKNSSLTAIEPSQKLFPTLQLKAGGFGRKFIMDIFENLNIVNKYDVILMNPPFGAAGSTAIAHVDKAFKHLNEGGRIVALIPRGSTDKKVDKWIQENESAKMVGEVILPSVTFTRAGTSVNTRVVIIDKITREKLRNKAPMTKRVDLSYAESLEKEDGLFEALRDITMPPRTIDQQMIDQKNAKKTMKTFKDIDGVFDASIKDNGVFVYGRYYGMNFEESFESMKSPEVYMTYKNRLDNISSRSRHSKSDDASIQFLETVFKTIENVSGKTGEQIMDSLPKNEGGIKMSDKYKYVLDMHSKTGADMHLAKPIVEGSLSNEEYTAISRLAKKHGGYWNRTKKAFHFDSAEKAEAFINDSVELEQVRYRIDNNEPLSSNESYADAIDEISSKVGYSVSTVTGKQISGPDSDIKRKAKAWYDPNRDTVTINLDNVVSAEDAQRSYLHEVVGHYGLRELFGEQFDDVMFKIYGLLPKNVQEEIQAYMLSNYSSQLAKISSAKDAVVLSMEEYLSRKAEENPDASWWDRICGSIRNLFRSIGIGIKFNDNDVRYMLWRSKNNLNKGRNVDFGKPMPQYDQPRFRMEENVTINEEELKGESVMEQAGIIATTIELDESERENFERRIKNTRIREGWQDRMIAVKRFQEKISEVTGKPIKSWENAYDYENTIASRSQYYIDEFKEKMMKPIYASISKLGDQNKVRDYLKAKHGLERNQKMRERELQRVKDKLEAELKNYIDQWSKKLESAKDKEKVMSDMQAAIALTQERIADKLSKVMERESRKDYSGLTGLYKRLYGSKESTPIQDIEFKFREFVSTYESEHEEHIEELWSNIRLATNHTLDFLHDTNILSKEMLEKIKSQYQYYVPLREWQEKKADQEFEYFSDHISDAFTDPLKKAEGRTSESGDPVASILNMAQSSIFIGHKNMMKLHSLRMVRNHRTNLANISSLWYVKNEDGEWEEVAADLDGTETYEEAQAKIASFEEKMKAKKELGLATRKKSSLNLGMPIKKWQARQHEIRVKELGQEYIIYINTDPRIAQAINGLNNINLSARKYAKPVNAIKTFMTTSYTTKNVAFIGSNAIRDLLFSLTNSFIKEGAAYSGKFVSSLWKSLTDLGAYIWMGKTSPELEVFLKNGGETGFVSLLSYEESMKEVQKGVDKYKKTLLVKDFFSVLGMVIERVNRHVENIFRYGIFLASRKSGKNVSESVKDAKEITVNFNRKGSGAYGSAYANMAYFFLNAGIQGLNNTVETAKKNKTRALIAYSFWAGLGFLLPALMCGDDDDCLYDDIPQFIRRQNICIPTGKNGYITIPLPIEIRALYSLGDMVYMFSKGKYNGNEADLAADLFGTLMTLMPKDFISGGNYELDYPKSIFFNAMPDWIKPITDTYMVNTTWTGRPIKKETPYNKYVPEYRKVYKGTNEYLVEASKFINKISGGNYAEKGSLDGPLNNPASLEYLIQQYMGGAARTYYQGILSTIRAIDPDKEVATKDVPVVNRFYKSVNTDRPMTNISERYFDYVEMSKEYESQKREYKRGLKEGEDLSGDFEEFMRNNKESISAIINGSSDAIQQLNTVRPFLDEEDEKELDKEIYKIQKDAVGQIDKLKK